MRAELERLEMTASDEAIAAGVVASAPGESAGTEELVVENDQGVEVDDAPRAARSGLGGRGAPAGASPSTRERSRLDSAAHRFTCPSGRERDSASGRTAPGADAEGPEEGSRWESGTVAPL